MGDTYRVFVGIDWADEAHQVCATDEDGRTIGERQVPHSGLELHGMVEWLVGLATGQADAVAVAIEVPHGPIVDTLLDRGCHVFSINPRQLDRFRDRFSPSGAKDDRRDAEAMSSAVRTDRDALRRLHLADPLTLQLREAARQDAELQEDFQRLANRLRDLLVRVWPELLRLVPAANEPWLWTLLRLAPTPLKSERLPRSRVKRLLETHHIRRLTADGVVAVLRTPSVCLAPGVREGVAPRITGLLRQIELVYGQRKEAGRRLEGILHAVAKDTPTENVREHQDVAILQSRPGIGTRIAATMLAEAAQALRERDYHALRVLGGVAPVTRRSGKLRIVQMRYACNGRLRFALRCWGMSAIYHDARSRLHYDHLRNDGHNHDRALRGVLTPSIT